jgi:perosamine synthetase
VIPVSEPVLGERELELVADCVRTGWISSSGRYIGEFEEGWASYCGRRHGVAVSNGTVALQLALATLDLQPGDEVLVPAFTIISCAMAVIYAGGVPVFVDADPETWCMDVDQVRSAITPRTRAVMPVHIYGHPVDMASLLDLANDHGLAIVEDAAEAHGAEYRMPSPELGWRRCGSFGDLSTFSFYANKLVTTGEGGMVLTDDDRLADRLRLLRNLAFRPDRRFLHDELGFNFRMTNIQAALGVAQLERMDHTVARKRAIAERYRSQLVGMRQLRLPVERPWARSVYWMNGIVLDDRADLSGVELAALLAKSGVETRPFFLGMHRQPALQRRGLVPDAQAFPVSDRLAERGLYLPSGAGLSDAQIDEVSEAVRTCLA